jgi:hypothetical protein
LQQVVKEVHRMKEMLVTAMKIWKVKKKAVQISETTILTHKRYKPFKLL